MEGPPKLFLAIVILALVPIITFTVYWRTEDNMKKYKHGKSTKLILFGSGWYKRLGSKFPYLDETIKVCPQCAFTQDLKYFNVSDAVVFHGDTIPEKPPTLGRHANQKWIWMYDESPLKMGGAEKKLKNYRKLIDWTMTFRRDSDIYWPYGRFVELDKSIRPPLDEKWAYLPSDVSRGNGIYKLSLLYSPRVEELGNRRMIAWISSQCKVPSRRDLIVKDLAKHISVDVYGGCGNFSCENPRYPQKGIMYTGNPGIDCRLKIAQQYKFYLSFENALCEDYVTEKFFDTLFTQMVPIVYGSADYASFAPEKSFINVADFEDVKGLADYLIYLDNNPLEYLKYFEWKKHYWVRNNGWVIGYCAICEKLLNPSPNHKPYTDIRKWFVERSDFKVSKKSACVQPNKFKFLNIV